MPEQRLAVQIATVLRWERGKRSLTQQALAELAGVSQGAVANIERGNRLPSVTLVARVFEAMGLQLTVGVEPLDAQVDARLAELANRPLAERLDAIGLDRIIDRLGDLPFVLTGATAALLQGAPIPVDMPEIAIRWTDSARFTGWLNAALAQRWNARWEEYGGVYVEPEEPGEHRWRTKYGEVRAHMCDELPETIEVRHGDRNYQVVPLVAVELTDSHAADLLRRHRHRADAAARSAG
ncbi:helix-turn-helix transcriptional regulator [Micromonospora endolithica]|uniref:XRE family transcriptional regulator n=1 Tax=Micromonospora endolithica TaxID=230091 RepID=A0A3A9Z7G0_9ACTN|nr:helix-turn-helix transcriptional regulator [Micromonospora endolithica]RKN44412.1 XRE family transcriptional regulator [Micromonospora endolithica]TWJ25904.1 helix-turn-helix protein [Micromonospora endolithica]